MESLISVAVVIIVYAVVEMIIKKYRKLNPKQCTFIYCKCGNEMVSDGSFVSDTYDENGDNHVRYKCKQCGKESDYNFDIAPMPINWRELKGDK